MSAARGASSRDAAAGAGPVRKYIDSDVHDRRDAVA
jgi:hypothetical protein